MTRVRALGGLTVLLLTGTLALAACGGDNSPSTAGATGTASPSAEAKSAASPTELLTAAAEKTFSEPVTIQASSTTDAAGVSIDMCVSMTSDPAVKGLAMILRMSKAGGGDVCVDGTVALDLVSADGSLFVKNTKGAWVELTGASAVTDSLMGDSDIAVSTKKISELVGKATSVKSVDGNIVATFSGADGAAAFKSLMSSAGDSEVDAAAEMTATFVIDPTTGKITSLKTETTSGDATASPAAGSPTTSSNTLTFTPAASGSVAVPTDVANTVDGSSYATFSELLSAVLVGKLG